MLSQDAKVVRMRCLVTGATGHIGSHLVRHLLECNVEVAALVRPTTSNLWRIEDVIERLCLIRGNLSNIERCSVAIREFAAEVVFHLGWYGVGGRHHDDVAQPFVVWQQPRKPQHLLDDFAGREITLDAAQPARAEHAAHRAADLRADADRSTNSIANQHRLDLLSIGQSKE